MPSRRTDMASVYARALWARKRLRRPPPRAHVKEPVSRYRTLRVTALGKARPWEGDLDSSAFVSLLQNAALLLVLVFVYDLLARYLKRQALAFKVLTGIVLGAISVAVMLAALELPSGVIFAHALRGPQPGDAVLWTIPGVIAGLIAATYRASLGGPGAVMGVSVIVMSVAVGALWRRWRHVARRDPSLLELYLFGLTVHVLMLALTVTLPWSIALRTFEDIAVPVIIISPARVGPARLAHDRSAPAQKVGAGAVRERGEVRRDRRPHAGLPVDARRRAALCLRQSAARRDARSRRSGTPGPESGRTVEAGRRGARSSALRARAGRRGRGLRRALARRGRRRPLPARWCSLCTATEAPRCLAA